MDLKNALAVCLISFFSATLVVLIARALDSQAESRIEPQLAQIVAELQALRAAGVGVDGSSPGARAAVRDDALRVLYFHGVRCQTCRAAEANAYAALTTHYAENLENGEIVWQTRDYVNDPDASRQAVNFGVSDPAIVLAPTKDGEITSHKRLDRVLALANDPAGMAAYLQRQIDEMLRPGATADGLGQSAPPADMSAPLDIPIPGEN